MLQTGPDVRGLGRAEAREARLQFWREKVSAALSSGQTQSEFCRTQGLSACAYFWWKRVLARMERGTKSGPSSGDHSRPKKKASFLPVTVRESNVRESAEYVLEIALGMERVIRVREGCDLRFLETVVRMVGGVSC